MGRKTNRPTGQRSLHPCEDLAWPRIYCQLLFDFGNRAGYASCYVAAGCCYPTDDLKTNFLCPSRALLSFIFGDYFSASVGPEGYSEGLCGAADAAIDTLLSSAGNEDLSFPPEESYQVRLARRIRRKRLL